MSRSDPIRARYYDASVGQYELQPGFVLTNDPWQLEHAAAIIVCVPTPVDAQFRRGRPRPVEYGGGIGQRGGVGVFRSQSVVDGDHRT